MNVTKRELNVILILFKIIHQIPDYIADLIFYKIGLAV